MKFSKKAYLSILIFRNLSFLHLKPFHIIGIGVAFSPNLKANINESARLALSFEATLVLIHVGEKSAQKEKELQEILQPFAAQNLSYELVFKTGDPVNVILSISEEKKVDLLILGALQRENFVKYYVGSIARKITRKAKCSVLLMIKPSVERVPCEHIVVNGLQNQKTEQTIASAFYVGHNIGAEKISIVEEIRQQEIAVAIDDDKSLRKANLKKERIRLREENRIKKIVAEIPEEHIENISIKSQPIFGKRGYSIGHYAQVVRADLLVMNAAPKMTFWDRLFPHDIEHILTELPTDVLIIQ